MSTLNELLAKLGEPISVDLSDPEDIRSKLPQVQGRVSVIRETQAALEELAARAPHWERLEAALSAMVAAPGADDTPTTGAASVEPGGSPKSNGGTAGRTVKSLDAVIAELDSIGGPISVAGLSARMPEFSRKTVGWALWKASKDGQALNLETGVYAPLSYRDAVTDITPDPNPYEQSRMGPA